MRTLKRRQIERDANEITNSASWLLETAHEIAERANADGYSGFGPGANGRAAGVSDPTAAAALARRDRHAELAAGQFADALYEAKQAIRRAERIGWSLLAIPRSEADRLSRQVANASGTCANPACGAEVLNTRDDRLRAGRCEACYRYKREHHGNERPRDLCHSEEVLSR